MNTLIIFTNVCRYVLISDVKLRQKFLPLKALLTMTDFGSENLLPEIEVSFAGFHSPVRIISLKLRHETMDRINTLLKSENFTFLMQLTFIKRDTSLAFLDFAIIF